MGLYAISFFMTLLLARLLIKLFYANTFFTASLAVFSMSLLEGWISLLIMDMLEADIDKTSLMLTITLPLSVLHALVTPLVLQSVIWGENLFLRDIS
jgi:hypothetical protein